VHGGNLIREAARARRAAERKAAVEARVKAADNPAGVRQVAREVDSFFTELSYLEEGS
jgi:hypothetical protein